MVLAADRSRFELAGCFHGRKFAVHGGMPDSSWYIYFSHIKIMTSNLILAGPCQDKLDSWMQKLGGLAGAACFVEKLDELEGVMRAGPGVLMLDFDLIRPSGKASLRDICADTTTIVVGDNISENMEWELLKAGVRGCCRSDSSPILFRQIVEAVQQGELWIRRTLTCRLIDELGKNMAECETYRIPCGLLNKLTQREHTIALCVGNGENNKCIAKSCAISERTVKAHLTEIYRKLGISDRLNLALAILADQKNPVSGIRRHNGFAATIQNVS